MKKISVKIKNDKKNYDLIIGKNVINFLPKKIKSLSPSTKNIAIFFDQNVPEENLRKLRKILRKYKLFIFKIYPSEKFKNFNSLNLYLEKLTEKNFNRTDLIISVGGGIIGDFSGFVASLLKRGVNFINVPTTLLAQVDSAIGGKTGVNSKNGKNLIGSFYQPLTVISDISFLRSLNRRQMICGYAEILKHSLIDDKSFFVWLKKNTSKIFNKKENELIYAINTSCKIKSRIVIKDTHEKNLRMKLNFGHTFAHALETSNKYQKNLNHGEAVLIGIILATRFSFYRKICKKKTLEDILNIYDKNFLKYDFNKFIRKNNLNKFVNLMKKDKKNSDEKINFMLLKRIGRTTPPDSQKIASEHIKDFLKSII